jgi:methionyl aminopeptidase
MDQLESDKKELSLEQMNELIQLQDANIIEEKKKKKKKKTKSKTKTKAKQEIDYDSLTKKYPLMYEITSATKTNFNGFSDNSHIVNLKNWSSGPSVQTFPPSIPISILYSKDSDVPTGRIEAYKGSYSSRLTDPAFIQIDDMISETIHCLRKAAVVHKQVRKYAQSVIRPGMKLVDVCRTIESTLSYLCEKEGLEKGQAFPTGCSLNNVAAHYTPNSGDERVLSQNDVCKIDFGTHYKGYLIDSAFTVAFDERYKPLLEAVKDATLTGVKEAGIDVRLCDIGEAIQEVMESYEVTLDGKTYAIQSVRNLCGHNIGRYKVHGGKSVPIIKGGSQVKMEEGEMYAIETFGSTGKGYVREDGECSHYMKEFKEANVAFKHPKSKKLLAFISKNYSTLAFCRRWLDEAGESEHIIALKELVEKGVVNAYPPLCDVSGSYVAQYEHTLLLKPSGKEIMSIDDDY